MGVVGVLDEIGKPAWIALIILGFIVFHPLGLVVLGFAIGSGRMGCWSRHSAERWQRKMERMQRRMQEKAARWCGPAAATAWSAAPGAAGWPGGSWQNTGSSGNWAFDEYRAETLRRLEEEQKHFVEFLERLRRAKDKAEFDQFMAEMRRSSGSGNSGPGPEAPPAPPPQV